MGYVCVHASVSVGYVRVCARECVCGVCVCMCVPQGNAGTCVPVKNINNCLLLEMSTGGHVCQALSCSLLLVIRYQIAGTHEPIRGQRHLNQSPSRQVLSLAAILATPFGQLFGLNKTRALSK